MYQVHNNKAIPLSSFLLLFIFIQSLSLSAFALESDRKAKVNIEADSVIYNYKTGVDTYNGHVKVAQGTTHILADRLVTKKNKQHKIEEAIAYGSLAHYWTLTKIGDPEVHGQAKVIKYYPIESNATLEQNVHVTQGENNFRGELIYYNSQDQIITVPASKNARAVIVYNPETK